ncbi:heme d1 biosynthesis radical SAM protein NirJ [Achromobacter marplatensis]|uniref:heme d1 biosynthesis radical SAM protein NirJ n=1 Tax=Achromobacter marplatensis TaxID=470868 RepID=UPI0039F70C36
MFRISAFVTELQQPTPISPRRDAPGPVVIWNLIRRCNLHCRHCYSASTDKDFSGELTCAQVCAVMEDLYAAGVRALILSGGEPLLRPDIFDIARYAKAKGFYVGLSSNGTLIGQHNIDAIAASGFDYVGVSLDGLGATHDHFRGQKGAFAASLEGIRLCRERGLKVGIRYTLTQGNAADLPGLLALLGTERVDRFYFSHLNYAGRGGSNRAEDSHHQMTRAAMEQVFDSCLAYARAGQAKEFTSGNNDADGVFFLHWVRRHYPARANHIEGKLRQWGGNASGANVANIDNRGNVHPDTMWWHYSLGNVLKRPFAQIWSNPAEPLLAQLRRRPRPVKGRCAGCAYLDICNGNTRIRAQKHLGDLWAEDPGCYLTEDEISAGPSAA